MYSIFIYDTICVIFLYSKNDEVTQILITPKDKKKILEVFRILVYFNS